MKEQVRIQTLRNAQKSRSLSILYDVAKSINQSKNLEALLSHFLYALKLLTHAKGASVRILTTGNQLKLISHSGNSKEAIEAENCMSIEICICGESATQGKIKSQPIKRCEKLIQTSIIGDDSLTTIAVPMMHCGKCLFASAWTSAAWFRHLLSTCVNPMNTPLCTSKIAFTYPGGF